MFYSQCNVVKREKNRGSRGKSVYQATFRGQSVRVILFFVAFKRHKYPTSCERNQHSQHLDVEKLKDKAGVLVENWGRQR